jgi:DNA polymerase (family 10)
MYSEMSKTMTNPEIADLFRQVAAVYSLQNQDSFRIQAYLSAAASIDQLSTPLRELWQEDNLEDVPGIGEKFCKYLDELFRTGSIKRLKRILNSEPQGMYPLLDVPGIGPKTAYKLAHAFHLTNPKTAIKKVETLAKKELIRKVMGFSEVSEQKILHAVEQYYQNAQQEVRMLLIDAEEIAQDVISYVRKSPLVKEAEVLGSLRRQVSTVGDIDIAVATEKPDEFVEYLAKFPHLKKIVSAGSKMVTFIHDSGRQVDIKTQFPEQWGSMLQHYTGSKLHNIHLRTLAMSQDLSLSENGIKKGEKVLKFRTEEDFYKALGLAYIPPELREDTGEIEAAREKRLPNLIEVSDLKGDFHIHTNLEFPSSHDMGRSSIAELLSTAQKLGYSYIGFSDHNPKQSGLTAEERFAAVQKRNQQIDQQVAEFSEKTGGKVPKVLKGLEVDILPDGSLALEDKALDLLDYAIVSIHGVFRQERAEMTKRILKALSHPKVKIWGHPSTRKVQKRPEIECDWEAVFRFAAENNKYIEVNSSPDRIDLPAPLIRQALKVGVKFMIDTDSHGISNMSFMKYGVGEARRGWVEKKDVGNAQQQAPF